MGEEHPSVTVARRFWNSIAEGDTDEVLAVLSTEIVWTAPGDNPLSGRYSGHDEVLNFLIRVGELADMTSGLNSIFYNDEGAVIYFTSSAQRQDKQMEMDYFMLMRISNGRIVSALTVATDQRTNDRFWNP